MTRYLFNSGELLQYADGTIAKGAPVTVYATRSASTPLSPLYSGTDGTTLLGSGVATTVNGEVPDFYGPDDVTDVWITAGGIRKHVSGIDVSTGRVVGQMLAAAGDWPEAIEDRVAGMLQAGSNVAVTYDDAAGKIVFDAAGGGSGLAGFISSGDDSDLPAALAEVPSDWPATAPIYVRKA